MKHVSFGKLVSRAALGVALVSMTAFTTACGSMSNIVTSLTLNTSQDPQGDMHLAMVALVNTGNLVFPILTLPVMDPNRPAVEYGFIQLRQTLDGQNELTLDVNVTAIGGGSFLGDTTLPNGSQIPVAGTQNLIGIRAGDSSRVYVAIGSTSKMIGVAVAIKDFDQIAKYVPNLDLFLNLSDPKNPGIKGLAGIFTSSVSGNSGVAIFVDATQVLQLMGATPVVAQSVGAKSAAPKLTFTPVHPNDSGDESELEHRMWTLSQHHQKLTIH